VLAEVFVSHGRYARICQWQITARPKPGVRIAPSAEPRRSRRSGRPAEALALAPGVIPSTTCTFRHRISR
jgi:hypothetical protein